MLKMGILLIKLLKVFLVIVVIKKDNDITGYLTNGYYKRDIFEFMAVMSAMQALINYQLSYQKLERKIK